MCDTSGVELTSECPSDYVSVFDSQVCQDVFECFIASGCGSIVESGYGTCTECVAYQQAEFVAANYCIAFNDSWELNNICRNIATYNVADYPECTKI